ncbi:r3h domain containing protein [Moniliophthora roreri MCA 2997]|uniref:R3h domain containing protein n=1 Tax=Moniliophthora roreri (strain MCA 2997) TaxID=1381753 RepID=V2X2S4_MONRO|nr:r3h domain containing protein [Moniliophthora roreri MCA 2997]
MGRGNKNKGGKNSYRGGFFSVHNESTQDQGFIPLEASNRGGRGRGGRGGGGRGRGGFDRGGIGNRGRGRGYRGGYIPSSETDFVLQQWPAENQTQFRPYSGGRGRGSGSNIPNRGRGTGFDSPRGRGSGSGMNTPRGHGRGRGTDDYGGFGSRGRGKRFRDTTEPLSRLLNEDRPLLKIIHFVPATQNRFLFQNQEDEEILKPVVEDIGDEEEKHIPTAGKVARVFSGKFERPVESDSTDSGAEEKVEEELEEIDFADVGTFQASVDASNPNVSAHDARIEVEETFTGRFEARPAPSNGAVPVGAQPIVKMVAETEDPLSSVTIESKSTPTDDVVMTVSSTIASIDIQGHDPGESKPPPPPEILVSVSAVPKSVLAPTLDSHVYMTERTLVSQPENSKVEQVYVAPAAPRPDTVSPSAAAQSAKPKPVVSVAKAPSPSVTSDAAAIQPVTTASEAGQPAQQEPLTSIMHMPPVTTATTQPVSIAPEADTIPQPPAFFVDTAPSQPTEPSAEQPLFFIDTIPTLSSTQPVASSSSIQPLGAPDPDEDIIVYVAPLPRSGRATPLPQTTDISLGHSVITGRPIGEALAPPPTVDSVSFSFPQSLSQPEATLASTSKSKPMFTLSTRTPVSARMKHRHRVQWARRTESKKGRGSFADRGIAVSERQLWKGHGRKGDSDIDWGTESGSDSEWESEEEEVRVDEATKTLHVVSQKKKKNKGEVVLGAEGMDVDPELELDTEAMKSFVNGINREHMTKEDLDAENANRVREEYYAMSDDDDDEEEEDEGEDVEVEMELDAEERVFIGEDDEDEYSEDDEGESPKSSFQARLERLRKQSQKDKGKGKAKADTQEFYEDMEDSDDEEFYRKKTWAEEDDDFIAEIGELLDEHADILNSRDRKARNRLFRAVRDGDFDFDDDFGFEDDLSIAEWMPKAGKRKNKSKHLPPDLAALWESDRQKKAAKKREREMERLLAAADPLSPRKGGKKARKLEGRAHSLSLDNRVIDISTLVQQIRRFLDDDGKQSMSLPPCAKETRKMVHELAIAFGLKSLSKGNGRDRFTTLSKTKRSAEGRIDENKVGKVVRMGRARGIEFAAGIDVGSRRGNGKGKPTKIREGDEVGKAAPKLTETNIGFRLLAGMGWTEGDRIGLQSGGEGLKDPLKAVMKITKLGLGASRDR